MTSILNKGSQILLFSAATLLLFGLSWGAFLSSIYFIGLDGVEPTFWDMFLYILTEPRVLFFGILLIWLGITTYLATHLNYTEYIIRFESSFSWMLHLVQIGVRILAILYTILMLFALSFSISFSFDSTIKLFDLQSVNEVTPLLLVFLHLLCLGTVLLFIQITIIFGSLVFRSNNLVNLLSFLIFLSIILIFFRFNGMLPNYLDPTNYFTSLNDGVANSIISMAIITVCSGILLVLVRKLRL